jgi:hypothetical protein
VTVSAASSTQSPEGKSAAVKAVLMGELGSPLEAALERLRRAAGWLGPIQDL